MNRYESFILIKYLGKGRYLMDFPNVNERIKDFYTRESIDLRFQIMISVFLINKIRKNGHVLIDPCSLYKFVLRRTCEVSDRLLK